MIKLITKIYTFYLLNFFLPKAKTRKSGTFPFLHRKIKEKERKIDNRKWRGTLNHVASKERNQVQAYP